MHIAGESETSHHRDGADGIDHVIDVKTVARALLLADACQRAVEAVAKPIQYETENCRQQHAAIAAGERITDAGRDLAGEAEQSKMVGVNPPWHALGHPDERALLGGGEKASVNASCLLEVGVAFLGQSWLSHQRIIAWGRVGLCVSRWPGVPLVWRSTGGPRALGYGCGLALIKWIVCGTGPTLSRRVPCR